MQKKKRKGSCIVRALRRCAKTKVPPACLFSIPSLALSHLLPLPVAGHVGPGTVRPPFSIPPIVFSRVRRSFEGAIASGYIPAKRAPVKFLFSDGKFPREIAVFRALSLSLAFISHPAVRPSVRPSIYVCPSCGDPSIAAFRVSDRIDRLGELAIRRRKQILGRVCR